MSGMTELDKAHAAMAAAPEDVAARMRFYEALADSEVFLLLMGEAEGDVVEPEIVETEEGSYVLAFDSEERLADFTGRTAPYAALSGRALVEMLTGEDLGVGLNLDVAPSSVLLPVEAVAWLSEMLAGRPEEAQGAVEAIDPPRLAARVVAGLKAKLVRAGGLAAEAWLVAVRFDDGSEGHVLAFVGAVPGAEAALAKAVSEAMLFSGVEDGTLDVVFLESDDPLMARVAAVGERFDLPVPKPDGPVQVPGAAPGMDPARPPKLK